MSESIPTSTVASVDVAVNPEQKRTDDEVMDNMALQLKDSFPAGVDATKAAEESPPRAIKKEKDAKAVGTRAEDSPPRAIKKEKDAKAVGTRAGDSPPRTVNVKDAGKLVEKTPEKPKKELVKPVHPTEVGDVEGDQPKPLAEPDLAMAEEVLNVGVHNDCVAVVWEVTFLENENVLSSQATAFAHAFEQNPPTDTWFAQSIREGLKKIFHPMGFTMTNSRSSYIGKRDDFNCALRARGGDLGFDLAHVTGVDVDTRRAARWLEYVVYYQHGFPMGSPGFAPEIRNRTTPLLLLSCERLL